MKTNPVTPRALRSEKKHPKENKGSRGRGRSLLTTVLFANTVLLRDPGRLSVCLSVVHLRQRGRCWLDSVCQHAAVRHSKPLCDALVCFLSTLSPGHPAPTVRSPYPRCPTPWEPSSVLCCSPSAVADISNTSSTRTCYSVDPKGDEITQDCSCVKICPSDTSYLITKLHFYELTNS